MRKYNEREKDFLKLLEEISNSELEYFSYFLQNKYFTKNGNSALFIIPQKSEALLFIRKSVFDDLKSRKRELKRFIEALSLIEYLKQNRLIDLIPNPQAKNIAMHILFEGFDSPKQTNPTDNIFLNQNGTHFKFPDLGKIYNDKNEIIFEAVKLGKNTYDLIMTNFMGLLFVSEELKDFVKKGFKSVDDIRYRNGQIATWVSITLAFIFGILGFYNSAKIPENKSYKIDIGQFDTLIESQKDLKQEIKTIFELIETEIDTTQKKVIK